jgi:hypothetical protein
MVSNLQVRQAYRGCEMKRFYVFLILLLFLTLPRQALPQESGRNLLLDVILTTYDIHRTETLVYLRVFSDGFAEAHPTHEVDFRTLALKQAQIPANDMARLRELLNPSKTDGLDNKYERHWGAIDFTTKLEITIGQGQDRKTIALVNFQPFLARSKKQPYPAEIEKLGCMIWELRRNVFNEPLDRDYVRGCREWGY